MEVQAATREPRAVQPWLCNHSCWLTHLRELQFSMSSQGSSSRLDANCCNQVAKGLGQSAKTSISIGPLKTEGTVSMIASKASFHCGNKLDNLIRSTVCELLAFLLCVKRIFWHSCSPPYPALPQSEQCQARMPGWAGMAPQSLPAPLMVTVEALPSLLACTGRGEHTPCSEHDGSQHRTWKHLSIS